MSSGPRAVRSIRALSCAFVLAALSACAPGMGGGDDGALRAASDERVCRATGALPAFAIAGTAPGTLLISTAAGGPAFAAFVQFTHANEPPVTGGRLTAIDAVGLTPNAATTFAAQLPPLRAGVTYTVTLQVMQDTDQAPECQKSLAIDLGPFRAS